MCVCLCVCVCVSECDREVSSMERPWPTRGCRAMEEKESGIEIHVAWSQDSTLGSTWTQQQSTLTNGLNSTSLLDYKFNLIYTSTVTDICKRRVALSCRPSILNDILIAYYDRKV